MAVIKVSKVSAVLTLLCVVFNIVDMDATALSAIHHKQLMEFTNVGAGIGGGFESAK